MRWTWLRVVVIVMTIMTMTKCWVVAATSIPVLVPEFLPRVVGVTQGGGPVSTAPMQGDTVMV